MQSFKIFLTCTYSASLRKNQGYHKKIESEEKYSSNHSFITAYMFTNGIKLLEMMRKHEKKVHEK